MEEVRKKFEANCADFEKGEIRYIAPMASQEFKDVTIDEVHFQYDNEIAELKYDGHRALMYINEAGNNRVFSRVVSKKTLWFTENTDNVPHFRDMKTTGLKGTVLDGEFDYGTTSMGVQSVMGSLPERAIKFQEENGNIHFKAFDILFYKGIDVRRMPLFKRKVYLTAVIFDLLEMNKELEELESAKMYYASDEAYKKMWKYADSVQIGQKFISVNSPIGYFPSEEVKSFPSLMEKVLYEEMEGIMVKKLDGIYESKRTKAYLKFKGESTWDCIVMGLKPSTKEYKGKELHSWKYWEIDGELEYIEEGYPKVEEITSIRGVEAIPVTKPYFNGWCGAIEFGVAISDEIYVKKDSEELEDYLNSERKDGKGYVIVDEDERHAILLEVLHVGDCKGLTEEIQEDIKEKFLTKYLGAVIEVRANGIINKETGTLRHPVFEKMRQDKSPNQCTFEDHIRVELK